MATRRKRYVRSKRLEHYGDTVEYANFVADLLDSTVVATRLVESRAADGKLILQYDDPNG